jgi:hypothetical protein
MTKNNGIPIEVKKPFETVYELKNEVEEIRLPMLSEITDKDGKVKLPPELIEKLRDPNARFNSDLVVFPLRVDSNGRWEWLRIPCPVEECMSKGDRTVYNWIHSGCGSDMQWSTKARLQCGRCESPSHISRWRFSCHRHTGFEPYSTTYFAIAVRLALKARNSTIDSNFSNELLDYLADHGDEF